MHGRSLPTRERGLKSFMDGLPDGTGFVAPYAGAWIEICSAAPAFSASMSLPTRERGLKYFQRQSNAGFRQVAPYAGAWIEMAVLEIQAISKNSRSLRGSVD